MIWSREVQCEEVVGEEGHPSVLMNSKGWKTRQIANLFRGVEAGFDIEKQFAPLDVVDYYGCLYPSQTTFGAYVAGEPLKRSRGLLNLIVVKI